MYLFHSLILRYVHTHSLTPDIVHRFYIQLFLFIIALYKEASDNRGQKNNGNCCDIFLFFFRFCCGARLLAEWCFLMIVSSVTSVAYEMRTRKKHCHAMASERKRKFYTQLGHSQWHEARTMNLHFGYIHHRCDMGAFFSHTHILHTDVGFLWMSSKIFTWWNWRETYSGNHFIFGHCDGYKLEGAHYSPLYVSFKFLDSCIIFVVDWDTLKLLCIPIFFLLLSIIHKQCFVCALLFT